MDRLNQLRGDAGASRDSTLNTSSLLGESYMTANDSSKYFSISEVDSSNTVSSSKLTTDDGTPDNIISNLSPIPKKSELDSFQIGGQIEAANILSGGVNIFDDNENSYDGDELVIDDAVAEGDDKPADIKLNENSEITFENPDRTADTNVEDAELANPNKDTEVVLQIDGKNVDAIDIGNGLYLYRKDGEEELAAVQILDDNQQQPDIKFLKVRENAEGNLEVYEEIEIEVPKEVPVKEGKAVKNTSHIPVKDVNEVSETISNKVTENKSQVPKDTIINEIESDLNKDNAQIESRTEVNLNGKMMKFSESRKSPLIGTFTPMTYHSTPNKEGIPLTKTMVDLQLHPNRHSETVKKTIEVHTDNCKQRLLETPTKSTKFSNEHSKNSELVYSTFDKDLTNYTITDKAFQITQENNKDMEKTLTDNKIDESNIIKVNKDKKINKHYSENNMNENKTEISDIKVPNLALEKPSVTLEVECKPLHEKDTENALKEKTTLVEVCSKNNNEISVTNACGEMNDNVRKKITEEVHSEYTVSKDTTNSDSTTGTGATVKENEIENISKDTDVTTEKQNINDIIISKHISSNTEKSEKPLPVIKNVGNDSAERYKYVKLAQNDLEKQENSNVKPQNNKPVDVLESSSKCNPNQDIKQIKKPSETGSSNKCGELAINMEIKVTERQGIQTLKTPFDNEKVTKIDTSQDRSSVGVKNVTTDLSLPQTNSFINTLHKSSQEENPKNIPDLNQLEDDSKINLSETVETKSNIKSNPLKHESKIFDNKHNLSKKTVIDDLNEGKNIVTENENKTDKLSKGFITTINTKLIQLDNTSSKEQRDVSISTPNTECKNIHKDSLIQEHNFSNNSLLFTKPSTSEKKEIQKKNEFNQKLSLFHKTKVPLTASEIKLPHSVRNVINEDEPSKNDTNKESVTVSKVSIAKPINNNKAAVPFGKWTEANRQEFLNKIKESKVPINTSNTKQLKQPNDLNRRDVLQKIDSQRQSNIASTKVQELNILNKIKHKHETTAFVSKSSTNQREKFKDNKLSPTASKSDTDVSVTHVENTIVLNKTLNKEQPLPVPVDMSNPILSNKKDSVRRKEINNQDLIDKTIEGIINRAVTAKSASEDVKQDIEPVEKNVTSYTAVSLDEIESKMNELHGIPFVERPPHELPKVFEHDNKSVAVPEVLTVSKSIKPSTIPFTNKIQEKNENKVNKPVITRVNEDSDDEIIEHEPVTGDIELTKNNMLVHGPAKSHPQESIRNKVNCDVKKEAFITENDFDKFARRTSITYENCLTVNFDGKEHHNVVQSIVEKETVPKKLSRNEIMLAESKAKSHKQLGVRHSNFSSKIPITTKANQDDDSYNKNYQSRVQIAYQSVMTAKRQQECPITIIDDKPVKVLFGDGNLEYIPHQLNVQGKELSPPKKSLTEWDHFTHSNSESLDSDILDASNDSKSQDDIKFKTKHQRKQVLTPVETPELELIEPGDLGIEVSPKKKRKIEDNKPEKISKSLVPKKSYLLNRNITMDDTSSNCQDSTKTSSKEAVNQQDIFLKHTDPISAIDNLVKAAELLETQSESKHDLPLTDQNSTIQQSSPVKRGRGRPRKYPLPEPGLDNKNPSPVKTPTPQKKPRLIDAKIQKHETESEDEEVNSDGELVKENWTMGKINENIVCPICNKLFRSENVVFKHVKHCTGPSPSRSDSDKRSPRRLRHSQDLDWKSEGSKSDSLDLDEDYENTKTKKKRKSKEKRSSIDDQLDNKTDVIVIEDTPVKDRDSPIRRRERLKQEPNKTLVKTKIHLGASSLVCEFCGKTFRQLSYLVNHRLQHKSMESKKNEKDQVQKSLFSCEVCKKEFRKLHHLVQHRIIHNTNPIRSSRKSSLEQNDSKSIKDPTKATEDQSAGFRCEPCDKSFRKLHHLVEHRETHDEINKKCNPVISAAADTTKPTPLHHCDICKKTFKKMQHLIEHKEHHLDTSSEKSDDKSVKSSLSTKDIIHECSLCYMVFPNEHSLNKHHIICQRKKKQAAAKQAREKDENTVEVEDETKIDDVSHENRPIIEQKKDIDSSYVVIEDDTPIVSEKQEIDIIEIVKPIEQKKEIKISNEMKLAELDLSVNREVDRKTELNEKYAKSTKKKDGYDCNVDKVSVKSKKCNVPTTNSIETIKIPNTATTKKKILSKDKMGAALTKRQKTINLSLPVSDKMKTPDSSDDDEIRYMLNPDFQIEETNEGKLFMKVRAKKRSSLQIERPNSKDLMKRRISLQHPPKIPRLKVKPIPRKPINTSTVVKSSRITVAPVESQGATDSDDSDVKYSFPEPVMKEMAKEEQKKVKRQKMVEKRKSLNNMAKRKSLGKIISAKQKINPTATKQNKKRTADAEHRCDCGQLFSSAALLSRHTSLAHTPPRIRRRRSPPPDNDAKPLLKRTEKAQDTRNSANPASKKPGVTTRKSSTNSELKPNLEARKSLKTVSLTKTRRNTPHKGVPVPEKMRKLMDKSKK